VGAPETFIEGDIAAYQVLPAIMKKTRHRWWVQAGRIRTTHQM